MDILKKRSVAILLSLLIVLGSTAATVSSKISKASNAVTKTFYDGVNHSGYMHKSIASQLNQILVSADGLVTIASNYGLNTSDVTASCRNLKAALSEYADDIGDIYELYDDLMRASNALIYDLQGQELSERDASGFSQYIGVLDGANGVISEAGYNEAVREFCDDNSGLLESVFVELLDIDLPETFS